MPTPRLSRQQLAAAATQLRGGVGWSPQRVPVARMSTALETSAAASRGRDGLTRGVLCGGAPRIRPMEMVLAAG